MPKLTRTVQPLAVTVRWGLLGVFVLFVAAGLARRLPDRPVLALVATAVALGAGGVAIVRPQRHLWFAVGLSTCGVVVLCNGTSSSVGWFALPVLAGYCALSAPLIVAGGYWLAAVLTLLGELLLVNSDPGWAAWIGGTTFSTVGCVFARWQRDLADQLREAQVGLAERAQAEERNRIARELHDVIAHSLTVSLLHVSSARLALADEPAAAERALAEAERLGRASLDEVRHAVGLLRTQGDLSPTTPLPGGLDVPELIERFRVAGARLDATVDGSLDELPGTVGLAVYRILQEALTNALKHARGAEVTARVHVTPTVVEVDVDSAGPPGTGVGLGLIGMRERAAALGGTCEAGPGRTGWRVHASLPLTAAAR